MCKILFVGGGSIGHIAPAIAVWQEFASVHPNSEAHFICSQRTEDSSFLLNQDLPYTTISATRLSWNIPWNFFKAYRKTSKIIDKFKLDIIFSKGGYVSVPACFAAHRKGVPIVLHESDTVSGRANWLASHLASRICTGFPTINHGDKYVTTGNPIRTNITNGTREEGLRITGFSGTRPVLLVIGGSQGAQALNTATSELLTDLKDVCDIIHITGRGKGEETSTANYWAKPFIEEELKHLYAITDIALSRAGAGSISELAANSIASILVPLRGVGHDHQQKNAEYVKQEGGCILLQQNVLQEKLCALIKQLTEDDELRSKLSNGIHALHQKNAPQKIQRVLEETLSKKLNSPRL